jgi:hypothetical protein
MDEQLNALNHLEVYDISTYQFTLKQTRGCAPLPRHSHLAHATSTHLIVMGGSACSSPFEREQCPLTDAHLLDLQTWTWSSIGVGGVPPSTLAFGTLIKLSNDRLLYLCEDKGLYNKHLLRIG